MSMFTCCVWWLLLGILLGLLLSWLLNKLGRKELAALPVAVVAPTAPISPITSIAPPPSPAVAPEPAPVAAPLFTPPIAPLVATPISPPNTPPVTTSHLVDGVDIVAAAKAGFSVRGQDDLKIVEGIGPKIDSLLKAAGINTFSQLAAASVGQVTGILEAAGPRFKLANPASWPRQAQLCADNQWDELKALQDHLIAGVDLQADAADQAPNDAPSDATKA